MDIWETVEEKHRKMMARVKAQAEAEGVAIHSDRWYRIQADEVAKVMDAMTQEERSAYRQASELGTLPGDSGGGWDLLYTPDQGAQP